MEAASGFPPAEEQEGGRWEECLLQGREHPGLRGVGGSRTAPTGEQERVDGQDLLRFWDSILMRMSRISARSSLATAGVAAIAAAVGVISAPPSKTS